MSFATVADLLRERAAEHPDKPAMLFPAGRTGGKPTWSPLSFGELDQLADRFAHGFASTGLKRGDRALVLVKPGADLYGTLFGLLRMGAIPVLLDPGMGMKGVLACIEQIGARAVIAISPVHAVRCFVRKPFKSMEIAITAGRRWFWGGETLAALRDGAPSEPYPKQVFDASDEAAIIFTSGSTGPAKGVSLRHGAFSFQVEALQTMLEVGADDVTVECFAAFAIFDVAMGMTCVIPDMNLSKPATAEPAKIVEAIEAYSPTLAFASPIVWVNLVRYCQANDVKLPSFRRLITVGAPIPPDLHRRFRELLSPGVQVFTPYGATEGLPVSLIGTDAILGETAVLTASGAGTCVGLPAPGMTIRVIKITEDAIAEWSDDLKLPVDAIGEVVIDGAVVSPEYKERPDANAKAKIRAGDRVLHRMGDLGYLDRHGRLWFCGRKAHRIETGSRMIPAVPVEGIYNEHPKVLRTALVGVGARGSETPILCVELEKGEKWTEDLGDELAVMAVGTRWEGVVSHIVHHPGFPTDARHNSKIRREDLKVWAEQKFGTSLQRAS
ncbi:MAG: peptide synthase [Deltaproteobacteria bacterium]|nr:MAG: peptide synthase [Deltaproteobacteria bacterium]